MAFKRITSSRHVWLIQQQRAKQIAKHVSSLGDTCVLYYMLMAGNHAAPFSSTC